MVCGHFSYMLCTLSLSLMRTLIRRTHSECSSLCKYRLMTPVIRTNFDGHVASCKESLLNCTRYHLSVVD